MKELLVLARQFKDIDDELSGDGVRIVKLSESTREHF